MTVDSVFEISSGVLGEGSLFQSIPKVFITNENGRRLYAGVLNKSAEFADGLDSIRCQWERVVIPGQYTLYLQVSGKFAPVEISSDFNVKDPEIDAVSAELAAAGETVTVTGKFFSSKPYKVEYLISSGKGRPLNIGNPLKYPDANGVAGKSVMDLESGQSEFTFIVPKHLAFPVPAGVRIYNRIGSVTTLFYPENYDLRDYNLVTPVKNQCGLREDGVSDVGASVGLCWAFATLASFESSLLKQGYQTDPEAREANLSPWYLGNYITYNAHPRNFNSELWHDPVQLDPPTTIGYNESFTAKGWGGGGGHWTCDYINGGNAVVLLNDCPIPNQQMTDHENLEEPEQLPSCGYIAKDMYIFDPSDFKTEGEFRNFIKKAILDYGGLQSYVHLDAVDIEGINKQINKKTNRDPHKTFVGNRFMDKDNYNYYCYLKKFAGDLTHAVCISGWDDDREINIDGHQAKGAWLVKDSTGENSHDQGYYWVAYDDKVLLKKSPGFGCIASGFTAHPGLGYKAPYLYQTHAGALSFDKDLGIYWYLQYKSGKYTKGKDSSACVQFTLADNEQLKAVGIVTMHRNEKVTISIYRNSDFPPSRDSETISSQTFDIPEKGYHMLDLEQTIEFNQGDKLAIVVTFNHQKKHKYPLVYVEDEDAKMPTTYWTTSQDWEWNDFPANSAFYLQAVMAD